MIVGLSTLLEGITTTILLYSLYGKKYCFGYRTFIFLVVDFILFQGINVGYIPNGISVVIYFVIVGYCIWEFESTLKSVIINFIIYFILLGTLQLIGISLFGLILPHTNSAVQVLAMNVLVLFLSLITYRKVKLERASYFLQQKDVIIRLILGIGAIVIIGCACYVRYRKGLFLGEFVAESALVIALCILGASWEAYKLKVQEKEKELQMYQLYEESFENLLLEIRMRQHEFNNHISAMYGQHLTCSTYEELVEKQRDYCGQVVSENRYEKLLVSGNTILVGFLYGKFLEAEKQGITVSYYIDSTNLNSAVPDIRLIELVGNLLNNALEALEKEMNKKLHMEINVGTDETIIEIRNTGSKLPDEEVSRIFTRGYSKKGSNRGIGLYNVKKLSREYGFKIICENQSIKGESWISFRLVFPTMIG